MSWHGMYGTIRYGITQHARHGMYSIALQVQHGMTCVCYGLPWHIRHACHDMYIQHSMACNASHGMAGIRHGMEWHYITYTVWYVRHGIASTAWYGIYIMEWHD